MPELPPYRDASLPIDSRVEDLLARMTPAEKAGQLMQYPGFMPDLEERVANEGIGSILCMVGERQVAGPAKAALRSRLGIPLLVGIDAIHGHSMWYTATIFPSQLGLSCSWSADLCERVARATAVEMAHTGIHWTFSPVLCMPRDLRWGRTGETFGEDGLIIGRLGAAMVRGYQGPDLAAPDAVAACAKHFVGYGESHGGRDASESDHSRRKLRWLFFPPFQAAVEAGCASFMTAYHAIDGVPCVFNRWMITEVLRGEWRWDGMVVTDWDIVGRMVRDRRNARDLPDATRRTLAAGNDLVMSTPACRQVVIDALADGSLPVAVVDEAVRRVLRLKFRLGLFENPRLPDDEAANRVAGNPAHRQLALEAARSSIVLLRNRTGVLPLAAQRLRRVAVVGPTSDDANEQLGDWQLGGHQGHGIMARHPRAATVTVLDGLRERLGADVEVRHARGCNADPSDPGLDRIPHAVHAATGADVCVLVLGDTLPQIGDLKSTATLELTGGQRQLFDALAATGVPLVVVLQCSKPLAVPYIAKRADAVLVAFNPGMEGGRALAEILLGDVSPSGRLTISWPVHVGQQPVAYDGMPGTHQTTYPDLPQADGFNPVFWFGEGLGYTTFSYRALRLASTTLRAGEQLDLSFTLTNSGERQGIETVQVYIRDLCTSVSWPDKRLKAWKHVELASGVSDIVRFSIPYRDLALCDADGNWVIEPGEFEVIVAPSAKEGGPYDPNILRQRFTVAG
jgi:beta-glucosidase